MLLFPHTYPLPWVLVTYVDTDKCSGFPPEAGASRRIIWQTLRFFHNKCNNANSRVSGILLSSDSLRGMAVSRSQYYLNFSNQCTGGHLMAGSSLRASHDSPDGVTAPVAGQDCPMAAGKTWCFLYAIVFHIVWVRSHVSHLSTFTWFSSQIVQAGPVWSRIQTQMTRLILDRPMFLLILFSNDWLTNKTACLLQVRTLLYFVYCLPDFMDFQCSRWVSVTRLGTPRGQHIVHSPHGRDHAPHGQSQTTPGPLSVHLLLYWFVPKGCGASLLDPGLHKSPLVHRRLSKLRVRR